MPMRAPSICGCGRTVPAGERCPCKPARQDTRPSAAARGYDREFREKARAFLRHHPQCACGAPATLVMHVISIRKRPDLRLDERNWRPGCRSCNAKQAHVEKKRHGEGEGRALGAFAGDHAPPTARNTPDISIRFSDGGIFSDRGNL